MLALDRMDETTARAALMRCCGATRFVESMLSQRPFGDREALFRIADEVWSTAAPEDVLEALSHHPEIGADLERLRQRFATTATWSSLEQGNVQAADEATLVALRDGNLRYRERFGYTFVVSATGKSAEEMLALLQARLEHRPEDEIVVAAAEQAAITRLRLAKVEDEAERAGTRELEAVTPRPSEHTERAFVPQRVGRGEAEGIHREPRKSPITTHVLDTSRGRPAAGVPVRLERLDDAGTATELARGITDADGRITDLVATLTPGIHRLVFEIGRYDPHGFYPRVPVVFRVHDPDAHYHVPLLLSPFGYSTYRGS